MRWSPSVPRRPSIPRRAAAAAIAGCFATLLVVPLVLDRSLLATDPAVARALVGVFGSLLALVVVGLAGHSLLSGDLGAGAEVGPLVDAPPERGGSDEDALVGQTLRDGIDRAATLRDDGVTSAARESVWKEIRTAAALAEEHATGASTEAARERVAEGRWTDDAVVATFLASPEADVRYPTRHVLHEWLTPGGAFERRAERAAETVRERYEDEGATAVPEADRLPPVRPVAPGAAPDAATAVLGHDLADAVAAGATDGVVALPTTDEAALREGLRAAAAAAVDAASGDEVDAESKADADSEPETDARAAVRNGEWTDDPVAAAFLADAAAPVDRSLIDLLYGAIDPSGALDRRARRTASAVLDRCESPSNGDDDRGDGRRGTGPIGPSAAGQSHRHDAADDADDDDADDDDDVGDDDVGGDDIGDTGTEDGATPGVLYRWPDDVVGPNDGNAPVDDDQVVHEIYLGKRR